MSITLPLLPLPDCGESYMYEGQSMHLYALAAVELYIASRAPMTDAEMHEIYRKWLKVASSMWSLMRAVEAHHVGAKP